MKVRGKPLFFWLYSPSWEEYSYMGIKNAKSKEGQGIRRVYILMSGQILGSFDMGGSFSWTDHRAPEMP
jgi:hypothetical protein